MADYRANNRNTKAVDLARVRSAARPAPGIVRNEERDRQMYAQGYVKNEAGVWYVKEKTDAGKKLDAAVDFLPTSALTDAGSGVYNLITQERNPWQSIKALPGVIGRSVMAPEKTDLEKKLWEQARGNPYEYRKLLKGLNPQQKSQNSIDAQINSNEKEYNDMVSMLKDTGVSEEELYRGVVVGPDGQVNLNANVQAALNGIGYAADALRGTELIGYGLGKPAAMAARAATKAAIPRAVSVATNPRIINAGMQSVEAAARGARPGEIVTTGIAALVAGNKPVSTVGTLGAWNVGATSRLGGLTKAQQEIESVVGKSLDEIQPNDWLKLIEEDPKLVTGATHRPRSADSNYNTNLAKRLSYNKLPSNIKAEFSGKVPYDDWWKQLSESEKNVIKAEHVKPTTAELQEYSRALLNDATQVDEAGNLVWKEGGKDLFYSPQDLAHRNPEGLPSVPGTDILGWLKRNTNTSEGYKIGAGRK